MRRRIAGAAEGNEMNGQDEQGAEPAEALPENLGLTEQPPADAAGDVAVPEHDHGDHGHGGGGGGGGHGGHGGHDHDAMVFSVFKRTPDGGIVEIPAQDIERDTGGYDEEGRDPGQGPERPPPPEPGHGLHHHGHP